MRFEPNHHEMLGALYLREAKTQQHFHMVHLGTYPGMTASTPSLGPSAQICGEIYSVPESMWSRLDCFEDCPHIYERCAIPLDDTSIAFAYLLKPNVASQYPKLNLSSWRNRQTIQWAGIGHG